MFWGFFPLVCIIAINFLMSLTKVDISLSSGHGGDVFDKLVFYGIKYLSLFTRKCLFGIYVFKNLTEPSQNKHLYHFSLILPYIEEGK